MRPLRLLNLFGLFGANQLVPAAIVRYEEDEQAAALSQPSAAQLETRFSGWGYRLRFVEPERSPISLHEAYAEAGGRILAMGTGMSRRGALLALERALAGTPA